MVQVRLNRAWFYTSYYSCLSRPTSLIVYGSLEVFTLGASMEESDRGSVSLRQLCAGIQRIISSIRVAYIFAGIVS